MTLLIIIYLISLIAVGGTWVYSFWHDHNNGSHILYGEIFQSLLALVPIVNTFILAIVIFYWFDKQSGEIAIHAKEEIK